MSKKLRLAVLREIRAMLREESDRYLFGTAPLMQAMARLDALIARETAPDLLDQPIGGKLGELIRGGKA